MEQTEIFSRARMLYGDEGMERLARAHVAVFGIGGVGGYAVEALARSGIGALTIVDNDTVSVSNRNRQIIALSSTVGEPKTDVMARRLHDINPALSVSARNLFFSSDTAGEFDFSSFDYVLDCIDTVTSKLLLISLCGEANVPLLAAMGTGNKTDPTRLRVDDISKTSVCPLARVMRLECRKRGIRHYRVVWSDEVPLTPLPGNEIPGEEIPSEGRRAIPASTAFVPPAAGLLMAREAVMKLLS